MVYHQRLLAQDVVLGRAHDQLRLHRRVDQDDLGGAHRLRTSAVVDQLLPALARRDADGRPLIQ